MNESKAIIAKHGRLIDFIHACHSVLPMVSGFEFTMITILAALSSAPSGMAEWTVEEAGCRMGVSSSAAERIIAYAQNVGLLHVDEKDDDPLQLRLTEAGRKAVLQIEKVFVTV